jgi:hypothetical protein
MSTLWEQLKRAECTENYWRERFGRSFRARVLGDSSFDPQESEFAEALLRHWQAEVSRLKTDIDSLPPHAGTW